MKINIEKIAIIHTDCNGLYHWTPAENEFLNERGAGFQYLRDCLLSIRESSRLSGHSFTHYRRLGRLRKIPATAELVR